MGVQERFDPDPEWLWAVRSFVAQTLVGVPSLDDIVLVASELAANVIRHAGTSFTVSVMREGERIRLEVADGSSIVPALEDLTESQRGLRLIHAIAETWGIEPNEDGKVAWAEFQGD